MSSTDLRTEEAAFIAEALRAEAQAVERIAEAVATTEQPNWAAALDLLACLDGHLVISGMGKSGLIAAKISATFSSLGQPSSFVHPAEAMHGDLGRIRRGDAAMLLSYSGRTEEIVNLAAILKADDVPRLGVSTSTASDLAKLCTVHLSLGDLTEACPLNLAPTASTTAMLAVGDALALALSRRRDFREDDFRRHHPGGMLGMGLRRVTDALRFRVGVNVTVVEDTVTVGEALERTGSERRAGAIVLVDAAGRLSGIFTDGDFRRLMRDDSDGMSRPIAEVMTPRPRHLTVDDLVRDAERLVREHRVDEIPVLDHDGRPVGLIDVQDLVSMKIVSE